jgi:predicted transcriptional regulator
MEKDQRQDWWDEISANEKEEIEKSLAEADRGEVLTHEEVMAKYRKHGRGDTKN